MEPTRRRARAARASLITAISLFAIAAIAPIAPAHAQSAEARQRFVDAEALFASGKVAEACALFEESNRIEPSAGTLINIGICKEKLGKLGSALAAYEDALARAKSPDKKKAAADGVAALEPRVSRLTISVAPGARVEGLAITRDGEPVARADWGRPIPVDGGSHEIAASAPGYRRWATSIRVAPERDRAPVSVPGLDEDAGGAAEGAGETAGDGGGRKADDAEPGETAGAAAPPGGPSSSRTALKATGYGLTGLSVATLTYMLYLTVAGPIPDFESGKHGVPHRLNAFGMEEPIPAGSSGNCSDEVLRNYNNPGNRAFDEACKANKRRYISGAVGLASGLAAGVVLYLAYRGGGEPAEASGSQRREVTVTPVIGAGGAGAVLRLAW